MKKLCDFLGFISEVDCDEVSGFWNWSYSSTAFGFSCFTILGFLAALQEGRKTLMITVSQYPESAVFLSLLFSTIHHWNWRSCEAVMWFSRFIWTPHVFIVFSRVYEDGVILWHIGLWMLNHIGLLWFCSSNLVGLTWECALIFIRVHHRLISTVPLCKLLFALLSVLFSVNF